MYAIVFICRYLDLLWSFISAPCLAMLVERLLGLQHGDEDHIHYDDLHLGCKAVRGRTLEAI